MAWYSVKYKNNFNFIYATVLKSFRIFTSLKIILRFAIIPI